MKKIGKSKLLSLLIFLSVALILVGVNFLEADKPDKPPGKKPPKWKWKIGIPTEELTNNPDYECNVYGNSSTYDSEDYAVFENNDFIKMGVQRCEDSETGDVFYHVYLRVYSNNEGYSIGLQNLEFEGCQIGCEDCWCCVFPPAVLPVDIPCSTLNCPGAGGSGFECMKNFMEAYDHPSWGYEVIAIRMYIFYDLENIPPGGSVFPAEEVDGQMWSFDIWNTSAPLINGNEEYHNIACKYLHWLYDEGVNNLENIEIHRSEDGNTWTVIVNQDGSPSSIPDLDKKLLAFRENYQRGVYKEKGKSGKYVLESEDCTALAARTKFKFITKWTRF